MISPELIRRYPFSAGLSYDQLVALAKTANEETIEAGQYFFREGEELTGLYLLLTGVAAAVLEVPDPTIEQPVSDQLTGALRTKDVVTSALGPGDVFGPSALIPPYIATSSVKAATLCRVIKFEAAQLRQICTEDCCFGYLLVQKTAQVIRDRLNDMRIESLAHLV